MIRLCLCGCGKEIVFKKFHKYTGIPKYIAGHHTRNMSDETRKKMSEKKLSENKRGEKSWMFGTHPSDETRKKLSESHKGTKSQWYGKHLPEETRKKIGDANRGEKNGMRGKHPSEETKRIMREKRLQQIFPMKDTKIEIKIQQALTDINIPYTIHKPILGQPDIFIEPNICIFMDGCYWHSCKQCNHDDRYGRIEKDKKVNDVLQSQGYKVLRFWEHNINNDIDLCIEEIKNLKN